MVNNKESEEEKQNVITEDDSYYSLTFTYERL